MFLGRQDFSSSLPGSLALIFLPGFVISFWIIVEPLFGVIEGVSAGLFLIGMLVAVVALFICRQKARWVQRSLRWLGSPTLKVRLKMPFSWKSKKGKEFPFSRLNHLCFSRKTSQTFQQWLTFSQPLHRPLMNLALTEWLRGESVVSFECEMTPLAPEDREVCELPTGLLFWNMLKSMVDITIPWSHLPC